MRHPLSLQDVSFTYAQGTQALQAVNLDIEAGCFTSLLGPSGCGKSTVLRLMAGLLEPAGGRVLRAPDEAADAEQRASIGFVFQEPTLMPWACVADNIALPLRLAGLPAARQRERVMQAMAGVGLADFAKAFPRELSGGMRMRVSIARALVTQPRLLLMDEPFAALDEITRFRLNNDLLALTAAQSLSVVFVTHSVFESVYLSQRVVVMSARPGRIVDDIRIQAPSQRDEMWRTSAEYAQQCRRVSLALERAAAAPAGMTGLPHA